MWVAKLPQVEAACKRRVFGASPFGPPAEERLLLDGCFWMFEARKAGAAG
jgi:hypothetical protein